MPVIQIVPDRFKIEEKRQLASVAQGASNDQKHIRRPVRGIAIKDDSFATLRVVAGSGKTVPIIDAGSRRIDQSTNKIFEVDGKRATDIYSNFFLQGIQEERAEKQQILETFGEPFIFLFGERARMITFSGILLNTFDFNWEAEWWHNYDNYLRGTRCVENDARIFLAFDETLVTGYITAASASKNAQEKNWVNFQFQMFVTGYSNYSHIGDPSAFAGDLPGQIVGGGDDGSVTMNITAADLDPFRPTRIDTNTLTGAFGQRALVAGSLGDFSLADGLAASVGRISQTFSTLKNQAETAIKKLSDLANGTVIRVPIGFAGAMEFDDETDQTRLREVTGAGVIKYSTFDQNIDEYVGSSDHYGSSVRMNGVVRVDENVAASLTRNQQMVTEATKIWAQAGFEVPSVDNSFVATLMVKTGFGLAAVGSNAAWRSKLSEDPIDSFTGRSPIRVPLGPGLVEE